MFLVLYNEEGITRWNLFTEELWVDPDDVLWGLMVIQATPHHDPAVSQATFPSTSQST